MSSPRLISVSASSAIGAMMRLKISIGIFCCTVSSRRVVRAVSGRTMHRTLVYHGPSHQLSGKPPSSGPSGFPGRPRGRFRIARGARGAATAVEARLAGLRCEMGRTSNAVDVRCDCEK